MSSQDTKSRFVVQVNDRPEQYIEIGDCLTIGRSPSNCLVLPESEVSRQHAEVRLVAPGRYRLSDLGSVNGTWLNGRRLTVPLDLKNGDFIQIGLTSLRFETTVEPVETKTGDRCATLTHLTKQCVVVLVADIRKYTSMTEVLPSEPFSRFITDWFREITLIIEAHSGIIDKFIGDAVMCFWSVASEENPASEIKMALDTTNALITTAARFSQRLSALFPGYEFKISTGISLGNATVLNVGTAGNQSFTILGDSVNIAFRLQALTKEKHESVLVSANLVPWAGSEFRFRTLGDIEISGRAKPVSVYGLVADETSGIGSQGD